LAGACVGSRRVVVGKRGLALRGDHSSSFMSDAFPKQIRFRLVAPTHAFVARPEAAGESHLPE
jgi:hypothetical protein